MSWDEASSSARSTLSAHDRAYQLQLANSQQADRSGQQEFEFFLATDVVGFRRQHQGRDNDPTNRSGEIYCHIMSAILVRATYRVNLVVDTNASMTRRQSALLLAPLSVCPRGATQQQRVHVSSIIPSHQGLHQARRNLQGSRKVSLE